MIERCPECTNLRTRLAFRTSEVADLRRRNESLKSAVDRLHRQAPAQPEGMAQLSAQYQKALKELEEAKTALKGLRDIIFNGASPGGTGHNHKSRQVRHAISLARKLLSEP